MRNTSRRRIALIGGASLTAAAGLFLLLAGPFRPSPAAIRDRAASLGARHGLAIGFGSPSSFFVPPYASEDARIPGGWATPADIDAVPAALDGIERSLSVYPPGFFAGPCKAIFICGSLKLDGVEAGGTYGKEWIVLVAARRLGNTGILETARLGVHHEFSSLVWNRFPELRTRWAALLPAGWTPVRDNAQALQASDSGTADPVRGFLSPYGATTAENDFNVYAEKIFTDAQSVAALADGHPVVARKVALLMAAYCRIDGRLASVFDRLRLARFRSALPGSVNEGVPVSPLVIPPGRIVEPGR